MVSHRFSLQLFRLSVLIITISAFQTSDSLSKAYETCYSLLKGDIGFAYPLWEQGGSKYCSQPGFELMCDDSDQTDAYPILRIKGDSYHVENITYSGSSVTISLQTSLLPQGKVLSIHNTSFGEGALRYSPNVRFLRFLYDCNETNGIPFNFSDSHDQRNITKAYYVQNPSDNGSNLDSCKVFKVPVLDTELDHIENENDLFKVLQKGFEVFYSVDTTACFLCDENSSKKCGPDRKAVCFSRDGKCHKPGKLKLILGIAIPGGFLLLIAVNIGVCCCLKNQIQSPAVISRIVSCDANQSLSDLEIGSSFYGIPVFSYTELQEATHNFDPTGVLGNGGFGIVYYGKLRDGREVAVKRLYEKNYRQVDQFMNEIKILTHLRHPNLVTLYGCTSRHSRELVLVYEYVYNGTLADHLYGEKSESKSLTWIRRMKIAVETASALTYLHNSDIIHRDVKTNNILLDHDFSVKLADFGISRLFPFDATHVSTVPQGTPGYLDPQYHKLYQVTNKSDVYSFGVVLIELISSLAAVDISRCESEINLSDYALNRIQQGAIQELVDKELGFEADFKVRRMTTLVAELAFRCLQQDKEVRPSMGDVFEELKRIERVDYSALEREEMLQRDQNFQVSTMVEDRGMVLIMH